MSSGGVNRLTTSTVPIRKTSNNTVPRSANRLLVSVGKLFLIWLLGTRRILAMFGRIARFAWIGPGLA